MSQDILAPLWIIWSSLVDEPGSMPEIVLKNDADDVGRVLGAMFGFHPAIYGDYVLDASSLKDSSGRIDLDPTREKVARVDSIYLPLAGRIPENYKRGLTAGVVMSAIFLMDRFGRDEPSMNKAIFVAQEWAKSFRFGDNTNPNRSEVKIREAWDQFSDAAHLWGALSINLNYRVFPSRDVFSKAVFPEFLSLAAEIWRFGIDFCPGRPTESFSVLEEITSYRLPESVSENRVKIGEFPLSLEQALSRYKAPRSI